MGIKGSRHRTGGDDFKKYQNNETLWNNLKKGKTEKELKNRPLAEGGIDILTGLEDGER